MKYALGIGLVFMCAAAAQAQTAVDELNQRLKSLSTFQAGFTQVTRRAGAASGEGASGQMAVQRPGQFRWAVTQPYVQTIVSDGRTLSIHDPDLRQLTRRPVGNDLGTTPALLFAGDAQAIGRQFHVVRQQQGSQVTYVLTPRAADSQYAELSLQFSGRQPVRLNLSDGVGQVTEIRFLRPRMNTRLPTQLFQITPPAGTDVIEEEAFGS